MTIEAVKYHGDIYSKHTGSGERPFQGFGTSGKAGMGILFAPQAE